MLPMITYLPALFVALLAGLLLPALRRWRFRGQPGRIRDRPAVLVCWLWSGVTDC
ncbi:MAG: hypothetical protein R3E79_55915 [Caldilineaceae bacterium]